MPCLRIAISNLRAVRQIGVRVLHSFRYDIINRCSACPPRTREVQYSLLVHKIWGAKTMTFDDWDRLRAFANNARLHETRQFVKWLWEGGPQGHGLDFDLEFLAFHIWTILY